MGNAAKLRKSRGYSWEDTLVKRFKSAGWKAVRLGSPSIHLPDVVAVKGSVIVALEAKAASENTIDIPGDQISRTLDFVDMFNAYPERKAIVAVKFLRKKRVATGRYKPRKKKEFFFDITELGRRNPPAILVTYDGEVYSVRGGSKRKINLRSWTPPWLTS